MNLMLEISAPVGGPRRRRKIAMPKPEPQPAARDEAYWDAVMDRLDARFSQGNDPGKVIMAAGDTVTVPYTRVNTPWRKLDGEKPPHKGARRGKKIASLAHREDPEEEL
jgi:hypothetical protein